MENEKSHARGLYELGSDFFREAAVLVVVFGLIERMIEDRTVGLAYASMVVGISGVTFMIGYGLERLRTK